jgi:hypothetical protein
MKYEGIGFNSEWVASQSLEDFMRHEKHHNLTKEQFKEAHRLARAKHKKSSSQSVPPEAGDAN